MRMRMIRKCDTPHKNENHSQEEIATENHSQGLG